MNTLKIIYMGTPEFAVAPLDLLIKNGHNICAVVTAPDRPAGRGRKVQESAVKKYALEQDIRILQPTNLKSETFIRELNELDADLQIVVAFRMLPKVVWQHPRYGTFNLHASLLPDYRGAAPINWAVMNGEEKTGVTTFFIDEEIDTGEIILQQETPIGPHESAGELHDRLMDLGASLVLETVEEIEKGSVKTITQKAATELKEAPKLNKENTRIQWTAPIYDIYNHIRGLSPYPAAWSQLTNGDEVLNVKIYEAVAEEAQHNLDTGTVITDKKELKIAVKGGYISVQEIQMPGKKRLRIQEVLNGYKFYKNAKMS
ncbi:methionyl-tRNA formyltransferase [Zeaxanthinibacter enoshimensis]|uniref:Methionyl-tRNA formyltransferase n=1 Tax=Zeaxanthinibacter enoshimensis TaxID=392009 RepID=A0A4R6TRV6_9FLAO|nr:methionyl-tRNA formyltransferase [Zeaxanthinibacter enoshimensis]TDQ31220.1 methionyl-tRNA formyltransferase [Zeaxanthinibacter enoshimensis]